jgi:TrmH family RNA methyltransferase
VIAAIDGSPHGGNHQSLLLDLRRPSPTCAHKDGHYRIGAILRQNYRALEDAPDRGGLGWLVINWIRSPGNLGTILRTAEAVGMTGIVFTSRDCDPYSPDVVRASMGGLFSLTLIQSTPTAFRDWCQEKRIPAIGLSPNAGMPWTESPYSGQVAIVIGEERQGIAAEHRQLCDAFVHLPMTDRADSLNVSIAAGVMMYELVRKSGSIRNANSSLPPASDTRYLGASAHAEGEP